jgi:hypothetical protein
MPYVYQVRILSNGALTNYFDITKDGSTVASCTSDPAGGRSLESIIQCQVADDLSGYSSLTGTVEFTIVFDAGGRTETIDAANYWIAGRNTVTFKGDISTQVSMQSTDTTSRIFLSRITMRGDTFFYYSPSSSIFNGGAITSGTFVFQIQDFQYDIDAASTEAYITSRLSTFGFPQSYDTLTTTVTPSTDRTTITVDFGAIPARERFWVSTFGENNSENAQYTEYIVKMSFNVQFSCNSGQNSNFVTANVTPIQGSGNISGNNKPVTTTSTKSGDECTASTKYTTRSDSVVIEIVSRAVSSLCNTATVTTTTTRTDVYTTTYIGDADETETGIVSYYTLLMLEEQQRRLIRRIVFVLCRKL